MATDSINFYVNMLAGSMQGLSAVSGLKSLDDAAAKTSANIQALEAKLRSAKSAEFAASKGGTAKEQFKAADAVAAAQSKLAAAQQAQAASAGLVAAKRALIVKGLDEQVSKLGSLAEAAQGAGGPVGNLAGKVAQLAKGGGGAVGIVVALVVGLATLATAAVVAAVSLAKYALVASDAARSSQLLSAAAAGSGSAGWELDKVVEQLSSKIPQTSQKTAEWARELALANIAGRDMQRTLTTMGTVASAVGDQAAGKIKGIAEASRQAQRLMLGARDRFGEFASLAGTGVKAADIYAAVAKSMKTSIPEAKRMVDAGIVPFRRGLEALELAAETRFGPIVARQMMSLDTQIAKLKENVARLFSGANIETFLAALKQVTDLFDVNTVTGYVLREVFTKIFTDVANVAAKAMPYVKMLIMGAAYGIILFATYAKQLARAFTETFGGSLKGVDKMKAAFIAGAALVGGLVGAVVGLTAAFVLLGLVAVTVTAPIWLPFVIAGVAIYAMVKAITAVIDEAKSLGKELEQIDLGAAAENIMNTLIDGIKAKIADVESAISDVGAAITGAFDGKMEIGSPSKVMKRRANWVIDPLVTEPERRQAEVNKAIGGLGVDDGSGKPPGAGGSSTGAGGPMPSFTFNNCAFGTSMQDVKQAMNEWWAERMMSEARGFPMPVTT